MTGPIYQSFLHRVPIGVSTLVLPIFFACGDGNGEPHPDPDPDPPRADSIALDPSSVSFDAIEDTIRVTVTVLDQYGDPMPGVAILWASDDPTVATVDQTGLVMSVRDGTTEVRAQGGTKRGSAVVEIAQEAQGLEVLQGNHQSHWTGFLLSDTLVVRVADGAGTAVVGEEVSWEVLGGDGTILPQSTRSDVDGEVRARWILGEGESGVQQVSATVSDLDPVIFEATGSAPVSLRNAGLLTAPMLDTLTGFLLTLDSLGLPESGIPIEFHNITGFGEIVQGPTTTDIHGNLQAKWALGPTPGPQEVTVVRTDINTSLDLVAEATGQLDPWPFTTVQPGFYHTCAVDVDGSGFCWGLNAQSQLSGPADTLPVEAPGALSGSQSWDWIGGGEVHTCGLAFGGDVYCWGQGYQTGQGDSTVVIPDPTVVAGGPWGSLTAGAYHVCALDLDGKGWCWGDELKGRLGNGVLTATAVPTEISDGHTWAGLSGGHFHTCGLTQDAQAYCWGQGAEGQLGNGVVDDQIAPTLVAGAISWAKISAGRFHSCGISTAGEAFCWGEGGFNQLGNGSTSDQTSPVKVAGGHEWKEISAGQVHTCAVDVNNKLYCWGRGGFVGLGAFGAPTPAVVLPPYDWDSVQTQGIHTCAITTIGETYCWGSNASGQLGIGNTDDFEVPRMVFRGVILP